MKEGILSGEAAQ